MKVKFNGTGPVSFAALGIEVEPGAEFEIDDSVADAYLRRPDVEAVEDPPPARKRTGKSTAAPDPVEGGSSLPGGEPAPAATTEEV